MKKITTDEKKMQLVERLVKEGTIDFTEAIMLLEVEVEKEFINNPFQKKVEPNPFMPKPMPIWYGDKLEPKDPARFDWMRIVCRQKSN